MFPGFIRYYFKILNFFGQQFHFFVEAQFVRINNIKHSSYRCSKIKRLDSVRSSRSGSNLQFSCFAIVSIVRETKSTGFDSIFACVLIGTDLLCNKPTNRRLSKSSNKNVSFYHKRKYFRT